MAQLVPASVAMLEGSLGAALEQEPAPAFEQVSKGWCSAQLYVP